MKLAIVHDRRILMEMEREEVIGYLASFVGNDLKLSHRKKAKLEKSIADGFVQVEGILKKKTIYII